MKNHRRKLSTFLALILICLTVTLIFTGCSETETTPFVVDEKNSSEGVVIEGNTLMINIGQTATVYHPDKLAKDINVKKIDQSTSDNGYITYGSSEMIDILPVAAGTCKLTVTFEDNSVFELSLYIRSGKCSVCEKDFDKEHDYRSHDLPCEHDCLDSVAEEHKLCDVCGKYICQENSGHNAQAPCGVEGHTVCDKKDHTTAASCGTAGHTTCNGQHQKLSCEEEHLACNAEYGVQICGHCKCEGEHFACPVCDKMNCENFEIPHEKYYCGHILCNETMEEGHVECEHCGDCITYGTHSADGCVPPEEE